MTRSASVVLDEDLDADLGDEVDGVLGTPVHLRLAALAAEAPDLGDGHALDAGGEQRILHLRHLVGLDDRRDQFLHVGSSPVRVVVSGSGIVDGGHCPPWPMNAGSGW